MAPQRKRMPHRGIPFALEVFSLCFRGFQRNPSALEVLRIFWGKLTIIHLNHGKSMSTDPPFTLVEIERTQAPYQSIMNVPVSVKVASAQLLSTFLFMLRRFTCVFFLNTFFKNRIYIR